MHLALDGIVEDAAGYSQESRYDSMRDTVEAAVVSSRTKGIRQSCRYTILNVKAIYTLIENTMLVAKQKRSMIMAS